MTSLSRSGALKLTKHTATGFVGSGDCLNPGVNAFAVNSLGVLLRIPRNVLTSSYSSSEYTESCDVSLSYLVKSLCVMACLPRETGNAPAGILALLCTIVNALRVIKH